MLAIKGIYSNGEIKLQNKIKTAKPVPVIVTFLEEVEKPVSQKLALDKFSFERARELLKDYHGSIGDAVIEERRNEL